MFVIPLGLINSTAEIAGNQTINYAQPFFLLLLPKLLIENSIKMKEVNQPEIGHEVQYVDVLVHWKSPLCGRR